MTDSLGSFLLNRRGAETQREKENREVTKVVEVGESIQPERPAPQRQGAGEIEDGELKIEDG